MPYYYGDMHRVGPEGCSTSQCSGDGTQPEDPAMKKCVIYKNQNDELSRVDSCTNVIAKDTMVCPQSDAVKTVLVQGGSPAMPALLQCTYTPKNHSSNDLPVNCYEPTRYELFMRAKGVTNPIDPSHDLQFCPASKAYYVDNTLSMANAKGLPAGSCPTTKVTTQTIPPAAAKDSSQPPLQAPPVNALAALMEAQGSSGKDTNINGILSKLFQK